jgi:hypothetical protein
MLRVRNWCLPLAALALAISFCASRAIADDAKDAKKDTGTVSGTVTDADGKPVADAEVGVYPPMKHGATKKAEQKAAGIKPIPVVPSVKSDDKGEFTINDVPAGDYMIRAFLKGSGQAREKLTVTAGETAKVELKLKKNGAGGGTGGATPPAGGDKPADPAK